MKKKIQLIVFLSIFCALSSILYIAFDLYKYYQTPASPGATEQNEVDIIPGMSLGAASDILHKASIIKSPLKFKIIARIEKLDKKIKAGEYIFSPSMTPAQIIDKLMKGQVILHKITIPEGFNITQIGGIMEKTGVCSKAAFIKKASDPEFVKKMNLPAKTFEGYLFPDTYYFPRLTRPEKVIKTMLDRFRAVFTPDMAKRAQSMGFTVHKAVTLASLVEKETGVDFERPIIASVFYNRLKKRMRLESDPTVIYGMDNFKGNITKKDLRRFTRYNTYRIRGLPPGPIANPGKKSIEAVLYPAKTKFLYFVSKENSTHKFSKNIWAHNRAVRKYQILRRSRRANGN